MEAGVRGMMITTDPPDHVRLRRLVSRGFTPRAVLAMEDHIRAITRDVLDGVSGRDECDFVTDIAAQLPLAVICGMMGVEKQDWPMMFELTNRILGAGDPEYQTGTEAEEGQSTRQATAMQGSMQMYTYFSQMIEDRRANRRDDLVSLLVEADIDGEKLSDMDLLFFCLLLILAGNETTRNAISGGMLALDEHPAEKQRLLADPSLIDTAVEEILRWTSPVAHMARVATADTTIRDKAIRMGDRVVMWYPSVNRDEDYFSDPYRFDITRTPNEHLAFGIGEHFCLGAGFARLEIKVMFDELFKRFPQAEVCGLPDRLRSNFLAGIKHLPVRLGPER
jgi:cytochrome P450